MFRTIIIPLLAIVGIAFAAYTVVKGSIPPPASPPVIEPPTPPFESFVAGAGLVEASTENLAIGSPVSEIIAKVHVSVGQDVARGEPLFTLDTRSLDAEMKQRQAALRVAQRELARLEASTRPELVTTAQAMVAEAQARVSGSAASLQEAREQLERGRTLITARAISDEELTRRQAAVGVLEANLARDEAALAGARADLMRLVAGSWTEDIEVARVGVDQARASIEALEIELDRRVVRSPVNGRVLQLNAREGEFAQAGALTTPLMLVGSVSPLHVRVDVDEFEAWRVVPGSPARAFARGNKDIQTPLEFVRAEPYIVPKRSLTGSSTERVDTRVLQVIYRFDPGTLPLYVGQQVDVYIQSDPSRTRGSQTGQPGNADAPKQGS